MTISYTGISGLTLTGVTGVTGTIAVDTVIVPHKQWAVRSQVTLVPSGADTSTIGVALSSGGGGFTFPGMPLVLSWSSILLANLPTGHGVEIGVEAIVPAGNEREFTHWSVITNAFFPQTVGTIGTIPADAVGYAITMNGYVNRQDQALPQYMRMLPPNRDVDDNPAGFKIGEYCWRDETEINAQAIVPTNWLTDPNTLGNEKFVAGIGQRDDLEPVGFDQEDNSIFLKIKRGFYYTGPKGYYLPATPQLDFLNALVTNLTLSKTPEPTIPIFVGTYALDSQGFYEKATEYRYKTPLAVTLGLNLPEFYYTLDRATNSITLSKPLTVFPAYLGVISGRTTDYFNLPIYPIDNVVSVYVQRSDGTQVVGSNWTLDKDKGTIKITRPSGSGTSIVGTFTGEIVMASCVPAVAVLYETDVKEVLTLSELDLNPAFAGVSGGFVYLQHSLQQPASIVLSADKPIINIPATYSSIIGLVAYGPVYFNGDYALLKATVYSKVPGQIVQGAELAVVVDAGTFSGTLNGLDPLVEPVTVVTGADGSANLIYRPKADYGFYIPPTAPSGGGSGLTTTILSNDTIVLPEPLPISQIWAEAENLWLVTLYEVLNNNPLFGKVGAGPGQIEWSASTSPNGPGTVGYTTNGEKRPLLYSSNLLMPIQALDAAGNDYTSGSFDGNVVKLVYGQTLPTGTTIGAFFITFTQRVLIKVQAIDSNVVSNSILLEMAPALLLSNNVWLILNDQINGRLNQYRLGTNSV